MLHLSLIHPLLFLYGIGAPLFQEDGAAKSPNEIGNSTQDTYAYKAGMSNVPPFDLTVTVLATFNGGSLLLSGTATITVNSSLISQTVTFDTIPAQTVRGISWIEYIG